MVDIFPRPDFFKIFDFEPNQYAQFWESSRVERVLEGLAQKTRDSETMVFDIFRRIPKLASDIELRKWHIDYRIAVMDMERAVDEFYWAYFLAQRAGFTVRKGLSDYLPKGHA